MGNCHLCGKPTQSHQLGDIHICHTCWTERSDEVKALEQEVKQKVEQPLNELEQNEQAGIRLIRMIQQYAMRYRDQLRQAMREYDGEVSEQTFPVFMNWFAFERELDDGTTPAERFAAYYDMPEWIATAIHHLQQPVRGFFEVTEKLADDRYTIRHLMDNREYELYGNIDLDEGDVIGNKIYPWLDTYLSGGALAMYGEQEAEQIRQMAEQFAGLQEKSREMQRRIHQDFIEYFGRWDPLFADEAKARDILSEFMEWRDSDEEPPKQRWDEGETALVSHPEHGMTVIPGYRQFKDMLDSDELDVSAARTALEQMPPWVFHEMMDDERLAEVISEAYDRDIDPDDIDAFMDNVRDDWQD